MGQTDEVKFLAKYAKAKRLMNSDASCHLFLTFLRSAFLIA
jgi:hypothetical protein